MKKITTIFMVLMAATAGFAALPQPDLLVRAYFAGTQQILASPNARQFSNEFGSAPALALRAQLADKLSVWLAGWLQTNNGINVPGGAVRLRPLFDDLQTSEWMLEAWAGSGGKPEVALAIKLDGMRAQYWQAGLKPFLPAASFANSGGWLIFDSGMGGSGLKSILAQEITTPHRGWFSLDANWPRLALWFPELNKLGLPETAFTVTAPDSYFRVDGKFFYPGPLALNLEPWKFPTNLVHQPFLSFTAMRGFASWLKSQDWAQPYQINPLPNQAYFWTLQGMPFQMYAAVPVLNAASALAQLNGNLHSFFDPLNARPTYLFRYMLQSAPDQITLTGLPMVAPYVQAANGPSGQFLLAGGFPNTPRSRPVPSSLFDQLAAKNLVYYHWEVTAEQAAQMLQPTQLGLLATGHKELDGNSPAYLWLTNTVPKLGNTVTMITLTAPDQLTFSRTATGIFTAGEFYALANWFDANNFPGCDLSPPSIKRSRHHHPAANVAPVPAAPR